MKRKAIQLANQTIVVSLPAKWVRQQGIKKGDEIDVVEEENRLVIGSKKELSSKIEINISGLNESIIWRYLLSIYRSGCDEVKVNFDNTNAIKLLNKIVTNLIGFEIVEQKSNYCLIKDISGIKGEEFENVLKRIFFILISTSEDFLGFMKKNELQKVNIIVDTDIQINKFNNYCLRLLHKNQNLETKKRIIFYHLIDHLEYLGDNLKAIAKIIINSKIKKISKETLKLFKEYYKILNNFFEFFYKFDLNKTKEIYEKRDQAQKIYEMTLKKLNVDEKNICSRIIFNIRYIVNLIDDIFLLNL